MSNDATTSPDDTTVPPVQQGPAAPSGITVNITPRAIVASVVVLALVVAAGLGLVWSKNNKDDAKGANTSKYAAIIDKIKITTAEVDSTVAIWIASKGYVKSRAAQGPIVDAAGKPTAAFRLEILNSTVQRQLIAREFEARNLKLPTDSMKKLRASIDADPIGKELPKSFIDEFVTNRGRLEALQTALSKAPSEDKIRAAYAQQSACVSKIQVAHILVKTKAEADAIEASLAAGGDFGAIAKKKSTDGSAAKGGDLGCFTKGQFVPEFEKGVLAAIVGTPTAPVKSQFGFHIIKTSTFVAPPLASVRADIVKSLQKNDTSFVDYMKTVLTKVKATIDPEFGTWKKSDQGFFEVAAPVAVPKLTTTSKP